MDAIAERVIDAVASRMVRRAIGSAERRGVKLAASRVLKEMKTGIRSWAGGLTPEEQSDALRVISSKAFHAALVAVVEEPAAPTDSHQLGAALRAESRTLVRTGDLAADLIERVRNAVVAELRKSPDTRAIYQTELMEQVARETHETRETLEAMRPFLSGGEDVPISAPAQELSSLAEAFPPSSEMVREVVGHNIDTARSRIRSNDLGSATTLLDEAIAAIGTVREQTIDQTTQAALKELEQRAYWSMAQIAIIRGNEKIGQNYATRASALGEIPAAARGVAAWVLINQGHYREARELLAKVTDSSKAISALRAVASLESGDFITAAASMPAITRKGCKVGAGDTDVDSDVASALVRHYVSLDQWDRASQWFWLLSEADDGSPKSRVAAMDAGAFLIQAFAAEKPLRALTKSLSDQAAIIDRTSELAAALTGSEAELSGQSNVVLIYRRLSYAVSIDEVADARRQWNLLWKTNRKASADLLASFPWLDHEPEKFRAAAELVETEDRRLLLLGVASDLEGASSEAAEFRRRLDQIRSDRNSPEVSGGGEAFHDDSSVDKTLSILREMQTKFTSTGCQALFDSVEKTLPEFAHSLLYLRAAADFVSQARADLLRAHDEESQDKILDTDEEYTERSVSVSTPERQARSFDINKANELSLALAKAMVARLDAPAHHLRLAEANFHLQRFEEVRKEIEILSLRSYHSRAILNIQANYAHVQRHLDQAADLLLRLHREFDDSPKSALRAGKAAFDAGRLGAARELFVEAMDTELDDDYARAALGIVEIDDLSDPTGRAGFQFLRGQYEKRPHPSLLSSLVLSGTRAARSVDEFAPIQAFVTSAGGIDKVPGLQSVSEGELISLIESSAEAAKAATRLYPLGAITFAQYAKAIGLDRTFVWLEHSERKAFRPTETHEVRQLDLVGNGLIVEETAWLTVTQLGLLEQVLKSVIPLHVTTQTFDRITTGRDKQRQALEEETRVIETLTAGISGYSDLPTGVAVRVTRSPESNSDLIPPEWASSQLAATTRIGGSYAIDIDDVRSGLVSRTDNPESIVATKDILRILQSAGVGLPISELARAAQIRPKVFPLTLEAARVEDASVASKPLVLSYATLEAWAAVDLLSLFSSWPGGIQIPEDARNVVRAQLRENSLRLEAISLHERLASLIRDAVSTDRVRICDVNQGPNAQEAAPAATTEDDIGEDVVFPALFDSRLAQITSPLERLYKVATAKRSAIWTDDGAAALFHSHMGPYIDEPPTIRLHASALANRTPTVSVIGTGRALEEFTKLGMFTPEEHLSHVVRLLEAGHWSPITDLSLTHALLSIARDNPNPTARQLLETIVRTPASLGEAGMIRAASGLTSLLASATIAAAVSLRQEGGSASNETATASGGEPEDGEATTEEALPGDWEQNEKSLNEIDLANHTKRIAAAAVSIVSAWTVNFGGARVMATVWWRSIALPAILRGRPACPILEMLVSEAANTPDQWIARALPAAAVQLAELGDLAPIFRTQSAQMFVCLSDACLRWDNPLMYERGWPRTPRTALAAWCGFVGVTKATASHEYLSAGGTQELFEFSVDSEEVASAARQVVEDYLDANGQENPVPADLAERVVLERQLPDGRTLRFEQPVDRISVIPESTPAQQKILLRALEADALRAGLGDLTGLYSEFATAIEVPSDGHGQDLSWFPELGKALSHSAAYLADYNFDSAVDAVAQADWSSLVALAGDPYSWRLGETLTTRVNRLTTEANGAKEEEGSQLLESARIAIAEAGSGSLVIVRGLEAIKLTAEVSDAAFGWLRGAVSSIDIDSRLVALAVGLRLVDARPDLASSTVEAATISGEIGREIGTRFPKAASLGQTVSVLLEETLQAMTGDRFEEVSGLGGSTDAIGVQLRTIANSCGSWTAAMAEFGLAAQQPLNAAVLTDAHLKSAGIPFSQPTTDQIEEAASGGEDALGTVAYVSRIITQRIVKRTIRSIIALAQHLGGDPLALLRRASLSASSLREQRPFNNVRVMIGEAWRPDLELPCAANPYLQQLLLLIESVTRMREYDRSGPSANQNSGAEIMSTAPAWWSSLIERILSKIATSPSTEAIERAVEAAQNAKQDRFETVFREGESTVASRILENVGKRAPRSV